jgi:hypothetical protein
MDQTKTPIKTLRYFVSYWARADRSPGGVAWAEIPRSEPIRTGRDLLAVADRIKQRDPSLVEVVITGWQRFEG